MTLKETDFQRKPAQKQFRYTKFINSNRGAHSLRSRRKRGRGKGNERGRKTGVWGLDPRFSPALAPLPPSPLMPAKQATARKAFRVKVGLK